MERSRRRRSLVKSRTSCLGEDIRYEGGVSGDWRAACLPGDMWYICVPFFSQVFEPPKGMLRVRSFLRRDNDENCVCSFCGPASSSPSSLFLPLREQNYKMVSSQLQLFSSVENPLQQYSQRTRSEISSEYILLRLSEVWYIDTSEMIVESRGRYQRMSPVRKEY